MKRVVVPMIVLVVLAAAIFWAVRQKESEQNGQVIRVSGNIEITDVAVSFKIAGRVAERLVSEGYEVKAGQVIARLDDTDLRQEVNLQRAEVAAAEATLNELERGSRPEEIRQGEAVFASAKAEEERWAKEYKRMKELQEEEVVSANDLEAVRMSFHTAQSKVHEAEQSLILLRKGPRLEKIEEARARWKRAQEALALAETKLGYATLASPMDGLVLSENIEAGEYVLAGTPIVTIGRMNPVWLRAYIDETDLGRVRVGQEARVRTDSYPNKSYRGRISFIASDSEFTPKNVQTEKERVKLVYRIKIDISNPEMQLKPGMPADAEIVLSGTER